MELKSHTPPHKSHRNADSVGNTHGVLMVNKSCFLFFSVSPKCQINCGLQCKRQILTFGFHMWFKFSDTQSLLQTDDVVVVTTNTTPAFIHKL